MIPLTKTTLGEEEAEAAARVVRSGWVTMGPEVEGFEKEFAEMLGVRAAVGVSNGTVALQLAYQVAGLGAGDDFLLPALTFVATMNAGVVLGGRPILVDCASEDDLTISPDDLERKLTPRARLAVAVPYGGNCPDMPRIRSVLDARGVALVEDACHAPLAELDGRKIGAWGLASTWSFYGNKNLTTGEGGMVATDDEVIAKRARLLRSHGMTTMTWQRHTGAPASYDVLETGYNFRLDEVRAAIGRVQLAKLPAATVARADAAARLRAALAPLVESHGLRVPFAAPRGSSANHLFVILLPRHIDRAEFRRKLNDLGVQTSFHYPPLDSFTHTRELLAAQSASLPVVRAIENRLVTIPLYPGMSDDDIGVVVEAIRRAL